MREEALTWAAVGLSRPKGEPITDPTELPDGLDDLLALSNLLTELASVVYRLRREVEAKAAVVLGPGRWYEYGDQKVKWDHGWTWKTEPEAFNKFLVDVAERAPDMLTELFNPNDVRKTGLEKAARALDLDPESVVATVLYRKWSDQPGLQWKPKE